MGTETAERAHPEVPGTLRLAWLLFMQPLRLHAMFAAWGLDGDPSLWELQLRGALRTGVPLVRTLVRRLAMIFFAGTPLLALVLAGTLAAVGLDVRLSQVAVGVAAGVATGVATGVAFGVARGVASGVAFGVAFGVAYGMAYGVAYRVALGVAGGVAFGVALSVGGVRRGVAAGVAAGVATSVAFGVAVSVALGVAFGLAVGVEIGVAGGIAAGAVSLRLPIYLFESACLGLLLFASRLSPTSSRSLVRWLPFRHHDLIYLPLPGLRRFLIDLEDQDPEVALSLIQEASATVGQKGPARRALVELQARSLERAARKRLWAKAGALEFVFMPSAEANPDAAARFVTFQNAARDLHAASLSGDYKRRNKALNRAREAVQGFRTAYAGKRRPDELDSRLQSTARQWLEVIDDELRALSDEERRNPSIPSPFRTGEVLHKDDAYLFKGRADLIRLIDHDLADDRRAPFWLFGQRRMGKSSLLNMLPERLGTGATVVKLNFQGLSGDQFLATPHLRLALELAKARPELGSPPTATAWSETLEWLRRGEPLLEEHRILVTIDEVEGLQRCIDAGQTTHAFLDFVRAAGDELRRIRLVLVSAAPPHRLGRPWMDRLISAVHRELSYLLPEEAEELIRNPMPDFPDIYPSGGVERIVRETHGHPFLVQAVCDALIRDLNGRRRLKADDTDLTRAFDAAISLAGKAVFGDLWGARTGEEQELLRRLSKAGELKLEPTPPLQELRQQGFVEEHGGLFVITVPLFGAWIRGKA